MIGDGVSMSVSEQSSGESGDNAKAMMMAVLEKSEGRIAVAAVQPTSGEVETKLKLYHVSDITRSIIRLSLTSSPTT